MARVKSSNEKFPVDLTLKKEKLKKIAISYFFTLLIIISMLIVYGNSITLTGFLLIVAISLVVLPLFLINDIFHPFVMLATSTLLALINFLDNNLNMLPLRYASEFTNDYSDYIVKYSIIIFITWYLFFYIGYGKTKVKPLNSRKANLLPAIKNPTLLAYLLFTISIIGILGIIRIFGNLDLMLNSMTDTTRTYSGLGYFRNIVSLGGLSSLLMLYAGKKKVAFIFMLLTCIMLSPFGGRGAIILGTVLPYLIVYNYKIKKIKTSSLITIGVFSFIFIVTWEQMRRYGTINLTQVPLENLISSVANNTRMADILPSLIGKLVNGTIDFQWGKPLLNIIYSPIPRSIWEGKPDIIDESVLIGSLLLGKTGVYGLPAGPYGWAFLNFGWLGVILMGYLTGSITKKFYWSTVGTSRKGKESFIRVIVYSLIIRLVFDIFATSAQINIIWNLFIFIGVYTIDSLITNIVKNQ